MAKKKRNLWLHGVLNTVQLLLVEAVIFDGQESEVTKKALARSFKDQPGRTYAIIPYNERVDAIIESLDLREVLLGGNFTGQGNEFSFQRVILMD